jgi:hypothetical protein
MANIFTVPTSGFISFDNNTFGGTNVQPLSSSPRILHDGKSGLTVSCTTTSTNVERFSVEGSKGRLFTVTDILTGTLFTVSDSAGLPVLEVSDNDTVVMGEFDTNTLVVSGTRVGIGNVPFGSNVLSVSGDVAISTNEKLTVVGNISATSVVYASGGNSDLWRLEDFIVACSDESTNLTTTTSAVTFRVPFAMYLNSVRASVNVAPVGSTVIVDIRQTGTSIFSTKLSIDANEETSTTAATPAVISNPNLTDGAKIIVSIDQVGSTTPGRGLKLTFKGYRV